MMRELNGLFVWQGAIYRLDSANTAVFYKDCLVLFDLCSIAVHTNDPVSVYTKVGHGFIVSYQNRLFIISSLPLHGLKVWLNNGVQNTCCESIYYQYTTAWLQKITFR